MEINILIDNYLQSINYYAANIFIKTFIFGLFFITVLMIIRLIVKEMKSFRRDLKKSREAVKWPHIDGVIVKSTVSISGSGEDASWCNEVEYNYVVNGKTYTSDRFSYLKYMGGNGNKKSAEAFQKEYPEGMQLQVFYNPEDPSEAVLSIEKGTLSILGRFGSTFFIILFISLFWILLFSFSCAVACTQTSLILVLYFIVLPIVLFFGIRQLKRWIYAK